MDWACHYKAGAVFDDQVFVRKRGIGAWCLLQLLHPGSSFWTFAEAAESYLKKFDM